MILSLHAKKDVLNNWLTHQPPDQTVISYVGEMYLSTPRSGFTPINT